MRKQIAAANWKMNLTPTEADKLVDDIIASGITAEGFREAVFAVPFPYLVEIEKRLSDRPNFHVAAQNCSAEKNGAYTGEISATMLAALHVPYVIIGHSERRQYYGETDEILARKADICLSANLKPIFCCGEPLEVREEDREEPHIESQLRAGLFHLSNMQIENVVIAYEPIWAIGTGRTATSAQAQDMHGHIRKVLREKYGENIAGGISILYGGSVKASNAAEIFSQPDVDGGLVGGASLVAEEFVSIIKSLKTDQ